MKIKSVLYSLLAGRDCVNCINLRTRIVRVTRRYKSGRVVETTVKKAWCKVYVKMYWENLEDGSLGKGGGDSVTGSSSCFGCGRCRGFSDDHLSELNRLLDQVNYSKGKGRRLDQGLKKEVKEAVGRVRNLVINATGWKSVYLSEVHKKLVKFCGEKGERTHTGAPAKKRSTINDAMWDKVGEKWY